MADKQPPTGSAENQLIEQLSTAVLLLDHRLQVRFANAAAEDLFAGSTRLLGAPFAGLFRYSSFELSLLQNLVQSGQTVSDAEVTLVLHDDKSFEVELTAGPATFDNSEDGILLELRRPDLVKQINQDQARQHQLSAAQELVRGLAHEIKNPLGGIRGAAQLLDHQLRNEADREYTALIMRQSDRLRELVDRLLGPNKPGERAWHNLHEMTEQALKIVALDKPEQVVLRKDYDPSLPEHYVVADQIEQVLLNLLRNAISAVGQEGEVILRTRVGYQQTIYGKQHRLCTLITVADDGPGIPDAIKDTLFYPLVTSREGGTGLGLSIAQQLVQQHGGKIEVHSRPGDTRFTIYLPYTERSAVPQNGEPQ